MSDFSDESDFETDEHEEIFNQAAAQIQRTHINLLPNDLLDLYALYKQATIGPCNTPKPGLFEMRAKAKWNAWKQLGDMTATEAKILYVDKVRFIDSEWDEKIKKGEKMKSPTSWVVHSTELPPSDLELKEENEKNAFDYVKERNLNRLTETLTVSQVDQLDEQGMGLIHWATDRNYIEILEFLLKSGANVNLRDAEQQTALHYAACCGHLDCLRILLSFNADRSIKDADGQTALDVTDSLELGALLDV